MDPFRLPLLTALFVAQRSILIQAIKLTSVNDSYHAGYLYMRFRSGSSPNIMRNDLQGQSISNVCNHIMGSGYADSQGIDPINMNFDRSTPQRYLQALERAHHIQIPLTQAAEVALRGSPYILGRLTFEGFTQNFFYVSRAPITDYVFVCLGRKRYSAEPVAYYVTREYNLAENTSMGPLGFRIGVRIHKPVRFIFKPVLEGLPLIALAEQPARVFTSADFNVELQYLLRREQHSPEQDYTQDPICKKASREHVALNQHERLCVAVLSSPYFEGRERYAQKPHFDEGCIRQRVEFQSESAINVASGRMYDEWMLECRATVTGNVYYISRSYVTSHLFVYTRVSNASQGVYLENFSYNVRVRDTRLALTAQVMQT